MADLFQGQFPTLGDRLIGGFAITKSDTTVFSQPTRAVFVGGAGNLAVTFADGASVVLTGVVAGTLLPIRVTQVLATGTTATNITGLY